MLKPGFFAEVTLAVESKKGALMVPEGAVQASEQGFIAYAVEDGKARVRPIEIGLRTGTGVVEILSGLKAGETVVIEGSDRLGEGGARWPKRARPRRAGARPQRAGAHRERRSERTRQGPPDAEEPRKTRARSPPAPRWPTSRSATTSSPGC